MLPPRRIPRLIFVTDRRSAPRPLPDVVAAAVEGGVTGVQLRERDLDVAALQSLATELLDTIDGRALLIINGHPTVAADLNLPLHLPESAPATAEIRRHLPPRALLGRSVHSPAAATAATGADYLLAGSLFPTPTHPNTLPLGLAGLRAIVAASWVPVLAIGGITPANARDALRAGAQGIAVMSAIANVSEPARAAADLRTVIDDTFGPDNATIILDEDAPMQITVNGKQIDVDPDTTVADYLADRGFQHRLVAVERNGVILPQRSFDSTALQDGDTLEIVHFVGGG